MPSAVNVRPLQDRIVIRRLTQEIKTSAGIVIPDSATEKPDQGIVLAVGPGKRSSDGSRIPSDLKEGDHILFGKYAGQTIKIKGEELLVMREEEVLAVIDLG
ncbi:putative co-chaperonin GroES [Candidatus Tremblaya phenacola PAVE]|nr:putative co-chaperonin GroES [Candidatus Tremblaya phenacola PAVE]